MKKRKLGMSWGSESDEAKAKIKALGEKLALLTQFALKATRHACECRHGIRCISCEASDVLSNTV